jgi:hypothetical protein
MLLWLASSLDDEFGRCGWVGGCKVEGGKRAVYGCLICGGMDD